MKLNNRDKNKIRKYIEEQLKEVPEGTRIELDPDLLSNLIFEKYNKGREKIIAFPVWTGEFLRKIDLSEIVFEGCCTQNTVYGIKKTLMGQLHFEEKKAEKKAQELYKGEVNFSYTNIEPEFNYTIWGGLENWNLEGTFLLNSSIDQCEYIHNCNFSHSKLFGYYIKAHNTTDCKFDGCDFNDVTIEITPETNQKTIKFLISNSFKYTELKIDCKNLQGMNSSFKQLFGTMYTLGKLDGCYLNGKYINPRELIESKKESLAYEYNHLVEDTYNSIDEAIKKVKTKTNNN